MGGDIGPQLLSIPQDNVSSYRLVHLSRLLPVWVGFYGHGWRKLNTYRRPPASEIRFPGIIYSVTYYRLVAMGHLARSLPYEPYELPTGAPPSLFLRNTAGERRSRPFLGGCIAKCDMAPMQKGGIIISARRLKFTDMYGKGPAITPRLRLYQGDIW